jgi:hypothetical protein
MITEDLRRRATEECMREAGQDQRTLEVWRSVEVNLNSTSYPFRAAKDHPAAEWANARDRAAVRIKTDEEPNLGPPREGTEGFHEENPINHTPARGGGSRPCVGIVAQAYLAWAGQQNDVAALVRHVSRDNDAPSRARMARGLASRELSC